MDGPWPRIGPRAMTEWGNRRLVSLIAVEKAELKSAGERERDENDQRGGGWKGHEHAGSVLRVSEHVKVAERDVLVPRDVGRSVSVHMENHVYDFSAGAELGRELLGGKGAGLAEMTAIGIPVPAGFTVKTAASCRPGSRRRSLRTLRDSSR